MGVKIDKIYVQKKKKNNRKSSKNYKTRMLPIAAITGIHRLEQNSITQLVYKNNLRLVMITINDKPFTCNLYRK